MADPITIERLIDATPDEAFAMFTEPERLRRWHTVSAAVDLRVGGDYRFTVVPGNVAVGTFTEIDPGRRVVLTWDWAGQDPLGSTVTVDFEPQGAQTLVRLTHEGLDEEHGTGHAEGWNHYADRLVVAASTGDAGDDPWMMGREEYDPLSAAEASWAICQGVMRQLTPETRELPTPCSAFTVHELVEHLMGSMRALGGMAGAEVPESIEASSAEDYIAQASELALAAWRDRGVEGEVPFGDGNAPATVPVGILSLEFLIHAWDFATAIGAPVSSPAPLTAFVQELGAMIIQPDNRGEGKGFAEETTTSSDDPLVQLMAFTGRQT
ncbi:MAG: TIGR03086 family protein [Acidimicrobiales bacterium]|nr:MAG: TIGR03086 family protein [Acidimicrobiales bacterium]